MDKYPTTVLRKYEQDLQAFLETQRPEVLEAIRSKRELNDEVKGKLNKALEDFALSFKAAEAKSV
jgi:F-type H+-transporting ATPase subunit alpha